MIVVIYSGKLISVSNFYRFKKKSTKQNKN